MRLLLLFSFVILLKQFSWKNAENGRYFDEKRQKKRFSHGIVLHEKLILWYTSNMFHQRKLKLHKFNNNIFEDHK